MLMKLQQLSRLKASLVKAPVEQVLEVEAIVRGIIARQVVEVRLAKRTQAAVDARCCPHCATKGALLHGKEKNGRQRFRCVSPACRRTYNILTGTPMARARKPELWSRYLDCMNDHLSVRNILRTGIQIAHRTACLWRHRFLKAAQSQNAARLSGVIEADEVFLLAELQGPSRLEARGTPAARAEPPSAWGAIFAGLSHEQVPVMTALDNAGGVYEAVLPSRANIEAALEGRIEAGSVLCSDGLKAYVKVAVKAGAEHRRVHIIKANYVTQMTGKAKRQKGRLGLGHVNAHHERLKTFISRRCRGVATKYLGSYLAWNRAERTHGFKGALLLDYAVSQP
jgi:transposase-like protein